MLDESGFDFVKQCITIIEENGSHLSKKHLLTFNQWIFRNPRTGNLPELRGDLQGPEAHAVGVGQEEEQQCERCGTFESGGRRVGNSDNFFCH
jgi:hypothetical protein